MFEWVKEDLKKISSHQHKYYLIISIAEKQSQDKSLLP